MTLAAVRFQSFASSVRALLLARVSPFAAQVVNGITDSRLQSVPSLPGNSHRGAKPRHSRPKRLSLTLPQTRYKPLPEIQCETGGE